MPDDTQEKLMGRPSDYRQETVEIICVRLVEGESLRKICRDDDMPAIATIFKWLAAHPEFVEQYAHAREAQADALADEIVDIADDGTRDSYKDADGVEHVDHDHIARARLRVDARKWIASKLKPKKYGDKIQQEVTGKDGAALFPVLNVIELADDDGTQPETAPKAVQGVSVKSD